MNRFLMLVGLSMVGGCLGMPKTVKPVEGFELDRYLGTWYEIARLDHPFERGLSQVSAEYGLRDDGGVRVVNRGYSETKQQWKQAVGKAYFVNEATEGYLKVSFFGPFYGSYVIFELDREQYQHAFVCGPDTDYLWLLSRTPSVDPKLIGTFVEKAKARGFDTEGLIFPRH